MRFCPVALLATFLGITASAANLELRSPQQLLVDQNGNATLDLTLCNNTSAAVRFNPVLTDFEHEFAGVKPYALGTVQTWNPPRPVQLSPGCSPVRLTVAKIWEAGVSTATLQNAGDAMTVVDDNGKPIGDRASLVAVRVPTAVNVQVVSPNQDSPEIHFVGNRALVGLKNSDPFNYTIRWRVQSGNTLVDGGVVSVKAASTTYFSIPPDGPSGNASYPAANWLVSGTLKDQVTPAKLILDPDFGAQVSQPLPSKEIPVSLRFSRFGPAVQQLVNAVFIFLFLAVGGLFSLFLNSGIPNYQGALALGRRLDDLKEKISGIDDSIESRWRVLLACHVNALQQQLEATPWWYPSFAPTLTTLSATGDMLQRWVDLAYEAALILHNTSDRLDEVPPTVLMQIEEHCERAMTPMQTGFTKEEELTAMEADVDAAQRLLDLTLSQSPNPDLEKAIKGREAQLNTQQLGLLNGSYPQFKGVLDAALNTNGTPLNVVDYVKRDRISLKADLIRAYDERLKMVPAPAGATMAAAAGAVGGAGAGGGSSPVMPAARVRLLAHGDRLAAYLVPDTHESLRRAVLFSKEMEQDLYADGDSKLVAAVRADPKKASISQDPQHLAVNVPAAFSLHFDDPILNEASARREWTCTWTFGADPETETGWVVSHVFDQPGTVNVTVDVKDLDGNPLAALTRPVLIAAVASGRFSLSKETHLEGARLGIVLCLALFGLMATAQQKAQGLSFWEAIAAVVAIGFGAGVVKDIIVRTDKTKETA